MNPKKALELACRVKCRHSYKTQQDVAKEYEVVIDALREKGFTWREISSWLKQKGVRPAPSHFTIAGVQSGTFDAAKLRHKQTREDYLQSLRAEEKAV